MIENHLKNHQVARLPIYWYVQPVTSMPHAFLSPYGIPRPNSIYLITYAADSRKLRITTCRQERAGKDQAEIILKGLLWNPK
jgi:hypothetical protein